MDLWSVSVKSEPVNLIGLRAESFASFTVSERTNLTHPVPIHNISIGRPGHVAVVLDTVETEGHIAFGRDVMVFGHNAAYQLGTGKRSNLCVPQHLHPLPPPTPTAGAPTPANIAAAGDSGAGKRAEANLNSGSLTHMPVSYCIADGQNARLSLTTCPAPRCYSTIVCN